MYQFKTKTFTSKADCGKIKSMETPFPTPTPTKKKSSGASAIISFAVFVLCALGVIVFFYNQNQSLKKKLAEYQQVPVVTNTPVPTPYVEIPQEPIITSPVARSKVKSPLTVTGVVPAGWMFEGTFPVRILNSEGMIISQTLAKEVEEGSWQSGNPVDFTATLTFRNSTGSGKLILNNDNPSGNPENDKEFEIPIAF